MTSHKKDELDEGEEEKKEQAGQIQNANTTELEEYDNINEKSYYKIFSILFLLFCVEK